MNRRHYTTHPQQRTDRHGIPVLPRDFEEMLSRSEYRECPLCDGSPLRWAGEWIPCDLASQLPHLHRRVS